MFIKNMKHLKSGYVMIRGGTGSLPGKQKEGEVNSMRLVKRITAAAMALTMTAALAGCGSAPAVHLQQQLLTQQRSRN